MAEERGMDLTDEIVCRNNRMYEFHNKYLEERNRKKEEMRDREVDRKFPKIAADYEKNKGHFEYGTGELEILVPKKASEITREGRIQHHCVGASDRYMESMETRKKFYPFPAEERTERQSVLYPGSGVERGNRTGLWCL